MHHHGTPTKVDEGSPATIDARFYLGMSLFASSINSAAKAYAGTTNTDPEVGVAASAAASTTEHDEPSAPVALDQPGAAADKKGKLYVEVTGSGSYAIVYSSE